MTVHEAMKRAIDKALALCGSDDLQASIDAANAVGKLLMLRCSLTAEQLAKEI